MSRPLRIEYKNAYYHVMNRGRGRQAFRRLETTAIVSMAGDNVRLKNLLTDALLQAGPLLESGTGGARRDGREPVRTEFQVTLPPHSHAVFAVLD